MKICPRVTDDGAAGARLTVVRRPAGCPGLGGWKQGDAGWWTRVKGDEAEYLLGLAAKANERIITVELDGDRIVDAR